jgi:hypothetical protein
VSRFVRKRLMRPRDVNTYGGRLLYHTASFTTGQVELALDAVARSSIPRLAWAARNLFELTIITDYLSRSSENRERFVRECSLDSLFIMDKFDMLGGDSSSNAVVEAKRQRLEKNQRGSRSTHAIATEIDRAADYAENVRGAVKDEPPCALGAVRWDGRCPIVG